MASGPGCVYRAENTLSPVYCPNEAVSGFGGYCVDHKMENPAEPTRCVAHADGVRCKLPVLGLVGDGRLCADHQPA